MSLAAKKILCPIDFDDAWRPAIELAKQIVAPPSEDGEIVLIHVVPMVSRPAHIPHYVDIYLAQKEEAHEAVSQIASRALPPIGYQVLTPIGDPAQEIIQAAEDVKAELIVISTHGKRGVARFFLGSVAEMVVRDAPCPVLAVRYRAATKQPTAV